MSITLRQSLALCLAALMLYAYSPRALAASDARGRGPAGDLTASGPVLLDGTEAVSGVTFFSGSEVKRGEDARAILGLGALARAEVLPQSTLRVSFGDEDVSASLGAGAVRLSKPEGVAAAVNTGSASVVADRDGAAVFTVSFEGGRTTVETRSGRVVLRAGGREVPVASGERYSEAQNPPDDDDGLSNERKAALILGIGGAVALLIILITTLGDDNPPVISPSR